MTRPVIRTALAAMAWLVPAGAAFAQDYALDAPDRAHSRRQIEVRWTAPQQDGGLIEIRADRDVTSRANYAYAHGNPQAIMAPEAPGEYVIVYIYEHEVRASRPLSVFLPEATLDAPAAVGAGETVEVAWTGPDSSSDNITFARRGGDMIRGTSYAYVGNLRGAPARLQAPADPGDYDVIYLSGSTVLARAPVTVGAISATLDAPAQVHAGGDMRVIWEGPRNAQDYISFAERNGEYIRGSSYAYVANYEDHAVVITAREQTGPVDIVYVSADRIIGRTPLEIVEARIDLDAPAEVIALEAFEARWAGAGNRGDQIRMLGGDGDIAAYRYILPDDPVIAIVAPPAPGAYDLAYVTREGREMARRPIAVLPPPQPPGTLTVAQRRAALGPDDAVGVILDASGSMLQRIGAERRIEIARETLAGLVADVIPAGTGFALRVFGHREAGSCRTDLEIPLGPLDAAAAGAVINGVEAMNLARTPLGRSIELAGGDLAGVRGGRLLIVLTDGEETCDGDPAAAIEDLRARGVDIRVNIVGFAIDDEALQQTFAAWAELGGGAYFSASDRAELSEALVQAMAARFAVASVDGAIVVEGRAGDTIALPAGDYLVRWGEGREVSATVPPGGGATVTLE